MLKQKNSIFSISLQKLTTNSLLVLLTLVSYSANSDIVFNEEKSMVISTPVKLDGVVFNAVQLAYEDFLSMGCDIKNYTVDIHMSEQVKIIFTPKFHPDEGYVLGGKTQYGREVFYIVDQTSENIIKKSFSR